MVNTQVWYKISYSCVCTHTYTHNQTQTHTQIHKHSNAHTHIYMIIVETNILLLHIFFFNLVADGYAFIKKYFTTTKSTRAW